MSNVHSKVSIWHFGDMSKGNAQNPKCKFKRHNDIFRVRMLNFTSHVYRHAYCSNMAKSGMNPKTLQYLIGHSDIGIMLSTYMHLGLEDAVEELKRVEELADARKELEKVKEKNLVS